jgi:hypothetical protein
MSSNTDTLDRYAGNTPLTLVRLNGMDLETLFTENGIDPLLTEIEAAARSLVFDTSTPLGRADCKSHAYKVAQTKTALDNAGKEIVSVWKKKAAVVDAERRKIRERLDALRDEIRAPVTEFEEAEAAAAENIRLELERVAAEERQAEAERVAKLEAELEAARERERAREEADRLTREEEERGERERKARAEVAKRAREQAEQKAAAEIAEAKAAQERAEREAREAAERAEAKRLADIETERRRGIEEREAAERARLNNERIEREAAEKKAANKKHRAKIFNEAVESLIAKGPTGIDAERVISLISEGLIHHVTINY